MKFNCTFVFLLLLPFFIEAQVRTVISETDSLRLYTTHFSNTGSENVFATNYKDGLVYISNNGSKYYKPYYADLTNTIKKIKISRKFTFGALSIFEKEI